MKTKISTIMLAIVLIAAFSITAQSQMTGGQYTITTTVVSGGGTSMSSSSGQYEMNGTMGQPSPLMDTANPPGSASYDLYPGFWYTLDATVGGCDDLSMFAPIFGSTSTMSPCDSDGDGDIDGTDLAEFAVMYE